MAAIDIPHFCTQKGHQLIEASQCSDRLTFIIEKGGGQD
jgi:TusA-related sulfurtransferase